MRATLYARFPQRFLAANLCFLMSAAAASAADGGGTPTPTVSSNVETTRAGAADSAASGAATPELRAVADALRELQAQVQTLTKQVGVLKAEQEQSRAETRELTRQLSLARGEMETVVAASTAPSHEARSAAAGEPTQMARMEAQSYPGLPGQAAPPSAPATPGYLGAGTATAPESDDVNGRLSRLEENQQFLDDKLAEQSQSKVESGSKYRLRLSGIVLMSLFANRGNVDNLDIPQVATDRNIIESDGSFGGSLRQSQIGLEVFGPDVLGAHTSADVRFDFAGGFSQAENGVSMGLMRLRTGTIRFDWQNTSIIAGQDSLFFAPLAPTSIATLAVPAMSYAGNLWAWTPQVRVEHRVPFSDTSSFVVQAGVLDSWSGDVPFTQFYRNDTWGEESAQPGYAMRVAWNHRLAGRPFTIGAGGYYGRQYWALGRNVDGWAGTADLTLPLGKLFTLTSQFYRGRAVAGLGGGIGQDVVVPGPFRAPTTPVLGLDSIGGWAQLKFKPTTRFEINGAFGQDNPYAGQLRMTTFSPPFYDAPLARNQSVLANFIYQPRSNMLFSTEYRYLHTFEVSGETHRANVVNLAVAYVF